MRILIIAVIIAIEVGVKNSYTRILFNCYNYRITDGRMGMG